ncbi:hypothetical protein HWV62_31147 [Athelia sp. TMB]|nr:hypothetical protein HWV62_31147 [Athelia sp. TMB]
MLRLSVLGWLATNYFNAIIASVPTSIALASMVFDSLTLPIATWLFYVRLSAVYLHDKRAMTFFGVLWGGVLAYFIFDSVAVYARYEKLHVIMPKKLDAWCYIINAIYDTAAYLAVSWQLAAFSLKGDSRKHRILSFFKGDGLLGLTKALLRSGQIYYFTTVVLGIASVVCLYSDGLSLEYRGLLVPFHVSISSILACRIFRELKLGIIPHNKSPTELELATIVFANPQDIEE